LVSKGFVLFFFILQFGYNKRGEEKKQIEGQNNVRKRKAIDLRFRFRA